MVKEDFNKKSYSGLITLVSRISVLVSSRKFLVLVLAFFLLQAIWFAGSIKYAIPADETYHLQFIQYYASQPGIQSPEIINQQPSSFNLGDIERTTSFLYHYLSSFVLDLVNLFSPDEELAILVLRIISILLAFATLLVILATLRELGASPFIRHVVIVATVFTGMFVWTAASINYDNLANLLFIIFLYYSVKWLKRPGVNELLGITLSAMAVVLTKTTFAPTLLVALVLLTTMTITNKELVATCKKILFAKKVITKSTKQVTMILLILNIVLGILFAGRIGGNLIQYGAVSPQCDKVHTEQQCLNRQLFKRDKLSKAVADQYKAAGGEYRFIPSEFIGTWLDLMYKRLYYYFGHKTIQPSQKAIYTAFFTSLFITCLLVVKRVPLLDGRLDHYVFGVILSYLILLFLFNLNTYLTLGTKFAYQGRYLLPIIPFFYYYAIKLIIQTVNRLNTWKQELFLVAVVCLVAMNIYVHTPVVIFLKGTDNGWYTNRTSSINQSLTEQFNRIDILQKVP